MKITKIICDKCGTEVQDNYTSVEYIDLCISCSDELIKSIGAERISKYISQHSKVEKTVESEALTTQTTPDFNSLKSEEIVDYSVRSQTLADI
jgi:recombinational DNA repair protein (RecF pathway)